MDKANKFEKILWVTVISLLVLLLVTVLIFHFALHAILVTGHSMDPTLDNMSVYQSEVDFTEGDLDYGVIVYFDVPDTTATRYVKRIVGLPGDTIRYDKDGLYRNGVKVEDEFNPDHNSRLCSESTLGENEYFVLGDNRNHSTDSRVFGPITYDDIDGIITKLLIRL